MNYLSLLPAYTIMYMHATAHYYNHNECESKYAEMYDFTWVLIDAFSFDFMEGYNHVIY